MKKTMYDLLGMIRDDKAPKRIIYDDNVYEWSEKRREYENEINLNETLDWNYIIMGFLNEEVEILEEEKKIPEKLNLKLDDWITPTQCDIELSKKIDEIIDYLKSKGDEKNGTR